MNEKRVRIFFEEHDLLETISRIYNLTDNKYKKIIFVNDNTYTHVILINKTMPILRKLPRENILGLAFEPNVLMKYKKDKKFLKFLREKVGKYYIGHIDNEIGKLKPIYGRIFRAHYSFMNYMGNKVLYENFNKKFIKKHKISLIASVKSYLTGHKYRHKLIKKILETKMDIHIYGRGITNFYKDERIKGNFSNYEEPYKNYHFTIAIENSNSHLYITEKYTNPLVFNCIPIYLGASKIETVFGEKCCIKLIGNILKDMEIISNIYKNPNKYYINLNNAKKELLEGRANLPIFLNNYWK